MGDSTPVGKYSPQNDSPYGCANMVGNVWEWTRSLWAKVGYKPEFGYPYSDRLSERENEAAGDDVLRVLRGGSFSSPAWYVRCACRLYYLGLPNYRIHGLGFRIVVRAHSS